MTTLEFLEALASAWGVGGLGREVFIQLPLNMVDWEEGDDLTIRTVYMDDMDGNLYIVAEIPKED